ncbi:MAG: hypothetical protein GF341_00635 [candidate division Zixibacteria bacterium]|nr:hypothetical protein [candidate division Zixibacteria bacterium]
MGASANKRHRPTPAPSSSTTALTEAGLFVLVALMAGYFVFLRYELNTEFPLATLTNLAEGTAYKPFQFRMLAPWLASGLAATGMADLLRGYQIIDLLAVIGLFYAFRYLLSDYLEGTTLRLGSFLVFYALPWNYLLARDLPLILPYDLAAVAFFAWGLALLKRRQWTWFYPVFVIACLNRETMAFLVVVLVAVEYGRMSNRSLGIHAAAMVGIWLAVKFVMGALYANNPGNALELYHVNSDVLHITTNIDRLLIPRHLLIVLSNFGFAWLIVAVGYNRIHDRFARRSLWMVPLFVLMILIVGNINEIRVFGELLPVVMLGVVGVLQGRATST